MSDPTASPRDERITISPAEDAQLRRKDSADVTPSVTQTTTTTTTEEPKPSKKTNPLREIIETALLALAIFLLVRAFVLNFKVEGRSMMPTFHDGEMLLVNRNSYRELSAWDFIDWLPFIDEHNDSAQIIDFGQPQRGDVIVFTPPAPGEDKPYIKRVIGIAGDTVEIKDSKVYVNGIELDETTYLREDETTVNCGEYCGPLTVPNGYVFVLGDNRNNSSDSRYFGLVKEERIIGKAWIVYWPQDRWRIVPHEDHSELGG